VRNCPPIRAPRPSARPECRAGRGLVAPRRQVHELAAARSRMAFRTRGDRDIGNLTPVDARAATALVPGPTVDCTGLAAQPFVNAAHEGIGFCPLTSATSSVLGNAGAIIKERLPALVLRLRYFVGATRGSFSPCTGWGGGICVRTVRNGLTTAFNGLLRTVSSEPRPRPSAR
jgi:hypothetical protein